jgi:hypothetical protein
VGSQRPGARRTWTWTRTCAHPGCTERAHYEYDRQRDMLDSQRRTKAEYRCTRHTTPEEVLSLTNTRRVTDLTARTSERCSGLFWEPIANGFAHGPGFRAWADDFPAGTCLRVTVEIILPDGEREAAGS